MSRFSAAVHLTNPKTRTREFFLKGQEIPDWAFGQIGDHLVAEVEDEAAKVAAVAIEKVAKDLIVEAASEEQLAARAAAKAAIEAESQDDDEDEDTDEGDSVAEGYAGWTNSALRDELIARSLPTGGKKDDLVARLIEDDA
jgi:hypothetical protein